MFTSQTLFKSESLGDKIKKQRKINDDLKAKIAIRDKQIAANKKKIADLEEQKKESQPSNSYLSILNQIKRNK